MNFSNVIKRFIFKTASVIVAAVIGCLMVNGQQSFDPVQMNGVPIYMNCDEIKNDSVEEPLTDRKTSVQLKHHLDGNYRAYQSLVDERLSEKRLWFKGDKANVPKSDGLSLRVKTKFCFKGNDECKCLAAWVDKTSNGILNPLIGISKDKKRIDLNDSETKVQDALSNLKIGESVLLMWNMTNDKANTYAASSMTAETGLLNKETQAILGINGTTTQLIAGYGGQNEYVEWEDVGVYCSGKDNDKTETISGAHYGTDPINGNYTDSIVYGSTQKTLSNLSDTNQLQTETIANNSDQPLSDAQWCCILRFKKEGKITISTKTETGTSTFTLEIRNPNPRVLIMNKK